ncbi:MAG: LacI family DNA-binding transcriptional regulator [Actinobacteria bacterium]|nr:LacI family DNA-binding transcriptional regulator [Actinomycetota bacterium]
MTQARTSVTIEDVAARAGVSRSAVSKVMRDAYGVSDAMRAKVETAIAELAYRPRVSARAMRGATYTLGIEIPTIKNPFFTQVISGAAAALEGTRYQLIIAPAGPHHDRGPQAIQVLADRQVDGIVAVSTAVDPEWLEDLSAATPIVMLGRHDASRNYDTVVNDDALGARMAVRHLYDLGHRDIAHVTIDPLWENHLPIGPHAVRARSYRETMAELGLADRTRVVYVPQEGGIDDAALALLGTPDRPTAVFAGHDEIALGVLNSVARLGLTTSDVSVVGYDDSDVGAHPMVALTSINQSGTRMGEIVVRLLLERIAGREEPVHEVITPTLMARRTTVPLASGDGRQLQAHDLPTQNK